MYGLESIRITRSEQDTLDSFRMKMSRRTLRVTSTCIDREWTNQRVFDSVAQQLGYHRVKLTNHQVQPHKIGLNGHIFRSRSQDPMRDDFSGTETVMPSNIPDVCKPRANWLLETWLSFAALDPNTPCDISIIKPY